MKKHKTLGFLSLSILLVFSMVLISCQATVTPETASETEVPEVADDMEESTETDQSTETEDGVEVIESPEAEEAEVLTVGILTNGPIADNGWSFLHNKAAEDMVEHFDGAVDYIIVESVPYGEEVTKTIEQLIDDGADIIIEGAYAPPFADIAIAEHPEVHFIVYGTALENPSNVQWIWWDQATFQYLLGMAAGLLTESDNIGYVVPFDIPLMRTEIIGYHMGARSVNPDVVTNVVSLNSWFDPAGARQAVTALVDSGVDVIGGDMDDPTKVAVAEELGVWAMGAYSEMQEQYGPSTYVNTYTYDFSKMFIPLVESVMNDTWIGDGELVFYELGNGVDIGSWGENVPEEVIDQVEATRESMISGEVNPFIGPIVDVNGEEVLAEGETWSDLELATGLYFALDGIKGLSE